MKLNKKAIAGAGLGVLALVGGTFAYYNQTATLDNPLKTGNYENEIVEDFTPPTTDIKPGATIDKKVGARNTGDYPVLVRIRMDEKWTRTVVEDDGTVVGVTDLITNPNAASSENFNNGFNITNQKDGLWIATQAREDGDTDGLTVGDLTVVRKNMAEGYESKWIFNAADGYWYYYKPLEGGEATEIDLLESISIASNIDLGYYNNTDWYFIGDGSTDKNKISEWKEYTIVDNNKEDNKIDGFEVTIGDITYLFEDLNGDHIVNATDLAWFFEKDDRSNKPLATNGAKLFRKNENKLDKEKPGYSDANYTLTVTSQFVQATPDAVKEVFGLDAATLQNEALKNLITSIAAEDYLNTNAKETSDSTTTTPPATPTP